MGCEKAFKTQSALKMHFRLHTGSRPFVCSYEGCSWAFPSSSKLRRHERGHKNVRSYVCEVCQGRVQQFRLSSQFVIQFFDLPNC